MIEQIFTGLTQAMSDRFGIALLAALGWGVISVVLSPCHLSSIPLVIGYLTNQGEEGTRHPYRLSTLFAVGILTTVAVIGVVTALLGRMIGDIGKGGNYLVGAVFVVVGLYLLDILPLAWGRILPKTGVARGWRGALILGLFFGIGLGPCTFAFMAPVLTAVFSIAGSSPIRAIMLVAVFGVGHAGVISFAGGAAGTVQRYLNWTENSKGATYSKRVAGGLVLLAGVYTVAMAV